MKTIVLLDQLANLSQALDLRQERIHRGKGMYDYLFFGLHRDVLDMSSALRRLNLQHMKTQLGDSYVLTVKFIWTPENIL